jgi:segregation and condensation protein B
MEGNMTPITEELLQEAAPCVAVNGNGAAGLSEAETNEVEPQGVTSVAQDVATRELKAIVESMLFVSSEPLSMTRLLAVLGDVGKAEIEQALQSLGDELDQQGRGIRLAEVAGGYRLVTKQEYAPWIKRLDKAKTAAKLSRSALESLAIIAYKQPIVRSEIEEIRGVETSGVVRTLLEKKLVRIVGRKDVPGRPIMYGTTKFFLEHFGLSELSQLPPLREFKELGESEQAMLPMEHAEEPVSEAVAEPIETGDQLLMSEQGNPSLDLEETAEPVESLKTVDDYVGEPVEQA